MKKLTPGKIRGLQQLADKNGIFSISAFDHRRSFKDLVSKFIPSGNSSWENVAIEKIRIIKPLLPYSSAFLVDPIFTLWPLITRNILPGGTGLLVSVEKSGYLGEDLDRRSVIEENWSVKDIKRVGGSGVKQLVYYHPKQKNTEHQKEFVAKVGKQCVEEDIPFVLEPMSYSPFPDFNKSDRRFAEQKTEMILQTIEDLAPLGADLLKLEFPLDHNFEKNPDKMYDACVQISKSTNLPWVLLSAAVDFDVFKLQTEAACAAGASGFLAGRATWKEVFNFKEPQERDRFMKEIAIERQKTLLQIATTKAKPWTEIIKTDADDFGENWRKAYTGSN